MAHSKEYVKAYREKNKERVRAYNNGWNARARAKNPHFYDKANARRKLPHSRYLRGKAAALWQGKEWTITEEEYTSLIGNPCAIHGEKTSEWGIGLDRIDSSKGYVPGNVQPCCKECNRIKSDKYTTEETKVMVLALLKFRNDNHPRP